MHSFHALERPRAVWAARRALFLPPKEGAGGAPDEVLSNHYVSAETHKACALIVLHLLAADYEVGSSGSQSPDLGVEIWVSKSSIWSSPCSASVTSGGDEEYGHNNEWRAIEVIGEDWSSEVVAPRSRGFGSLGELL